MLLKEGVKRKFEEEVCGVCLGTPQTVAALQPCFHEFCLECICTWLLTKQQCPLCKQGSQALFVGLVKNAFEHRIDLSKHVLHTAWAKRAFVDRHFEEYKSASKLLMKKLYHSLRTTKLTVEVTRRWIYMCGLKTIVYKKYLNAMDVTKTTIDPGHKVWKWLQVELEIFLTVSKIRSFLKFAKMQVSSYANLVDAISAILSPMVLPSFFHEMNSFLLYNDSCERYYTESDIKMTIVRLPGQSCDTIIIKDGQVCLNLLSKIIIKNIFILEHEIKKVDCDLSTFQEISHIYYLVQSSSKCTPEQFLINIQEFVKIRLERLGRVNKSSFLPYFDPLKFCPQFLHIYIDCYNRHKSGLCHGPTSDKRRRVTEPCITEHHIDLTNDESVTVVDLTGDDP